MKNKHLLVSLVIIVSVLSFTIDACTRNDCLNGGICSPNGDCQCTKGFAGLNCTQIACANGGVGPDSSGTCKCAPGFGGINCLMCTDSTACNQREAETCDKNLVMHGNYKYYECNINDEFTQQILGRYTSLQCNRTNGICNWEVFDGTEQSTYCQFSSCHFNVTSGTVFTYTCDATECHCTSSLTCNNPYTLYILENMKGTMKLACDKTTSKCELTQQNYLTSASMSCKGAECRAMC
jgi:hypothetical protein